MTKRFKFLPLNLPFYLIIYSFLFSLLLVNVTMAAPGDLDTTFNGSGKVATNVSTSLYNFAANDVKVLPDNKFLVVGSVGTSPNPQILLLRYNTDVTPDTTFGTNGRIISNAALFGVGLDIQSDGKIIVAASGAPGQSTSDTVLVRFNSNGSVDNTFGTNGVARHPFSNPQDIVIQPDNKIVIVGQTTPPQSAYLVSRFNPDGSLDNTFGSGGSTTASFPTLSGYGSLAYKIALQNDGKILAGGQLDDPLGKSFGLVRFNSNGTIDDTFGLNGRTIVNINGTQLFRGMTVQPDGKIIMAGATGTLNNNYDFFLTRINPDGSFDPNFGSGGLATINISALPDYINDVVVQNDGKIFVSGQTQEGVLDHSIVARLNSNGNLDTTFGDAGKLVIRYNPNYSSSIAIGLRNDGQSIVVGQADLDIAVAQVSQTGTLLAQRQDNIGFGQDIARDAIVQPDGKIVVAGNYQRGTTTDFSLVRYLPNGNMDSSFGIGGKVLARLSNVSSMEVFGIALQTDGKIVATGKANSSEFANRYTAFIARFNPDGSRDTTFSNNGWALGPGISSAGYAIAIQPDGKIVVAGEWAQSLTGFHYNLFVLRLNTNGTADTGFGSFGGVSIGSPLEYERANAVVIQPDGKIVAGGSHLIRLNSNGSIDTTFSPGLRSLPYTANDIAVQSDGKILIGGTNVEDFLITRFNTNGTVDNSFGHNGTATIEFGNFNYDVANSIVLQTDGSILAGGYSQIRNATQRNFAVARLSPNGTLDNRFGNGGKVTTAFGNGSQEIWGLTLQNDGKLIAVGETFNGNDHDFAIARYLTQNTRNLFDFNGDGRDDIAVYRPTSRLWYQLLSPNYQFTVQEFGLANNLIVPADFDGDGKTDLAVFNQQTGDWSYRSSVNGNQFTIRWGTSGDIPRPSDFDGDGKADFIVYRPTDSTWYRLGSQNGQVSINRFGTSGDKPLTGDFDGDGKSDLALYRPNTGGWWYLRSTDNLPVEIRFGIAADIPVPADYDGDGKTDLAVYRSQTGVWYILNSGNGTFSIAPFGIAEDKPVPADYDGDGKADIAVFRPSTGLWYLQRSTAGFTAFQFGVSTDVPIPNAFVP